MEWNVYIFNCNGDRMEVYNIFNHYTFNKYVKQYLKECKTKEEFAAHLQSELRYYFWSKAEWEIIISPWVGSRNNPEEKIDVYKQVMLNWDKFLDYVWSHKTYETGNGSKCLMANRCLYSCNNVHCDLEELAFEECPYLQAIGEIARLHVKAVMKNEEQYDL